ncbi:PAS domain S-box-containing protein [Catalinimonas alkaloidigena]|uniref:histidine kinase n=2 Tax=Catalinimonas alkaloidigena TaxID=1075417 RepID=A0A1G9G8C0_9BACT|nr:PAS domain S-box-containing protein [Catalinimonas alkaloidigena]
MQDHLSPVQPRRVADSKRIHVGPMDVADILFDDTFAGFWDWEIAHKWRQDDQRFRTLLGYELHELGTDPDAWRKLIHPDDYPVVVETFQKHVDTHGRHPYSHTCRYLRKDGSHIELFCHGTVHQWDAKGQPLRMRGYYINLTSTSTQTRHHVTAQTERLNLIMQGVDVGLWDFQISSGKAWWSPHFYELLGYSFEELKASQDYFIYLMVHPTDREKLLHALHRHYEYKDPLHLQLRIRKKDGQYEWFDLSGQAQWDHAGTPKHIVGLIRNIQLEKQQEQQLQQREFQLQETSRIAHIGAWEVDVLAGEILWTDEVYKIHELPTSYHPTLEEAFEFFAPASRPVLERAFSRTITHGERYDLELEFVTAKGQHRWVRAIGEPVFDSRGKAVKVRGVFQDIDRQKQNELQLQQHVTRLTTRNGQLADATHQLHQHAQQLDTLLARYAHAAEPSEQQQVVAQLHQLAQQFQAALQELDQATHADPT